MIVLLAATACLWIAVVVGDAALVTPSWSSSEVGGLKSLLMVGATLLTFGSVVIGFSALFGRRANTAASRWRAIALLFASVGIACAGETTAMRVRLAGFCAVRGNAGDDVGAITSLYADGHRRSEAPYCFDPSMVEQGIFRGVWEDEELVAVAGTHLVVPSEGACAVGNAYARHDQRGRGFGARVTSAVASAALARGIPTVVLNVDQRNASAIRVYEGLGFRLHCDFVEGPAFRS
jgi:ribosomal protein S18 acetylase RimI-like enzyme